LSATYLKRRNHAIDLKSKAAEVELAQKRGILVERKLVEQQATWLLLAAKTKLINLGSTHAHKFIGLNDVNAAKKILREIGLNVLAEIRDLPKTVNPGWLKEVETDEGK